VKTIAQVGIAAGVAYLSYFLCKSIYASMAKPLPSSPASAPLPPPSPGNAARLVTGPLTATPGHRYYVTVTVGFPASIAASQSKVASLATSKGFTDVSVSTSRPQGWPGQVAGDYYITGVYRGTPTSFDRNPGPGVNVVEGFEQ
jgi:hypothetical protein